MSWRGEIDLDDTGHVPNGAQTEGGVAEEAKTAGGWEPIDVVGALAMRQNGFSEREVAMIYGSSPPNMSAEQFARSFADSGTDVEEGIDEDED